MPTAWADCTLKGSTSTNLVHFLDLCSRGSWDATLRICACHPFKSRPKTPWMDAAHMQATRTMFPSDCMHDMLWSNEMVNDGDCISHHHHHHHHHQQQQQQQQHIFEALFCPTPLTKKDIRFKQSEAAAQFCNWAKATIRGPLITVLVASAHTNSLLTIWYTFSKSSY